MLRSRFRPTVEALNERVMLSSSPLTAPAPELGLHSTDAPSIQVRLVTDQLTYRFGQPVIMKVVQTNMGRAPVHICCDNED